MDKIKDERVSDNFNGSPLGVKDFFGDEMCSGDLLYDPQVGVAGFNYFIYKNKNGDLCLLNTTSREEVVCNNVSSLKRLFTYEYIKKCLTLPADNL